MAIRRQQILLGHPVSEQNVLFWLGKEKDLKIYNIRKLKGEYLRDLKG